MELSIIIAIVEGVIKEIPEAISAWSAIKAMVAEKRDPTADEWKQIAGAMGAVHAQVQAATVTS